MPSWSCFDDDARARTVQLVALVRALVMTTLCVVAAPRVAFATPDTANDDTVGGASPPCHELFDPEQQPRFAPFAQGALRLTLAMGLKSTLTDNYVLVGAGVGYYVVDGLELGVDYQAWVAGDPTLHQLGPEVRYVLQFVQTLKPYFGVFYRHTFVKGYVDLDGVGVRAGLYYAPETARAYFGGGFVYEHLVDCALDKLVHCDEAYPEASFGVSF
jgi:hypothetical protein